MNRLPSVTAREMVAALKRAGFEEDGQRGSHLRLWHPKREKLTTVHPGDLPGFPAETDTERESIPGLLEPSVTVTIRVKEDPVFA